MNIQRTTTLAAKRALKPGQNTLETPEPKVESEPGSSAFKDIVTKGAYASGGALAGVGLGVATGLVRPRSKSWTSRI